MAATYITDAAGNTKRYELEPGDVLLLGSGEECDICISDTEGVAAQHCELLWDDGYYILNTCTDELKVQVNGESLDCVALVSRVEYFIGGASLLYMDSEEEELAYFEDEDDTDEGVEEEEDDGDIAIEEENSDDLGTEPEAEGASGSAPRLTRRSAAPPRLKKKAVPGAPRRKKKKLRPRTVVRSARRSSATVTVRSAGLRARRTVVRPKAATIPVPKLKPSSKPVDEDADDDLYAMEVEESEGADFLMSVIKPLYVVAVLAMAFLAGLTVHHLIVTGQFYPTSRIESVETR